MVVCGYATFATRAEAVTLLAIGKHLRAAGVETRCAAGKAFDGRRGPGQCPRSCAHAGIAAPAVGAPLALAWRRAVAAPYRHLCGARSRHQQLPPLGGAADR